MQEKELQPTPCRVKTCPANVSQKSRLGYCPIHNVVATDPVMFDKALEGKISAGMKEFAKDIDRGLYPKSF
jgi:hypothetical protein